MRRNTDEAKKEIGRILAASKTRSPIAASAGISPRLLKFIAIRVFVTDVQPLLDTGAVPNLLSNGIS